MHKKILLKFLPKHYYKILSFFKTIIFMRDAVRVKNVSFIKNKDRVIVLGNGPSLAKDIEDVVSLSELYDFYCVNNFATNSYFVDLKPTTYIFLDGYFFKQEVHADWQKKRIKTFCSLNENTTWPMNILLPYYATRGVVEKYIQNKNINIKYVKCLGLFTPRYTKYTELAFRSGFFGPEQINVLIYAIYYSIWAGYEEVVIYGADLSFHNDVEVDQGNNLLTMNFRHFSSNDEKEYLKRGPMKRDYETMYHMLDGSARTFKAHEILEEFSKSKGCSVINKSSFSLIDAYKRS